MEISARLQTSILPREFDIPGLEVAARMVPASEVGGDYYDLFPVEGGAWLSIGDVAGHGISAGLVMIMVQSAIAALGRDRPDAKPSAILAPVNAVLYENIRRRLRSDEHVTLSLLRYHAGGRIVFAGAHEEMIVCRAATGRCEAIPTPGAWLGGARNIERVSVDSELELEGGDVLVLYTDGVTEARDAAGTQLGLERLFAAIEEVRESPVERIVDHILDEVSRWAVRHDDDATVLVVRYSPRSPDPTS
jgi:phosphoserine phosphatase RsbU/P